MYLFEHQFKMAEKPERGNGETTSNCSGSRCTFIQRGIPDHHQPKKALLLHGRHATALLCLCHEYALTIVFDCESEHSVKAIGSSIFLAFD